MKGRCTLINKYQRQTNSSISSDASSLISRLRTSAPSRDCTPTLRHLKTKHTNWVMICCLASVHNTSALKRHMAKVAYVAPTWQTAHLASINNTEIPVYFYHWAPKSSILGSSHGDTIRCETFDEAIFSYSQSQNALCGTFHAYITSFICRNGDPNALTGQWQDRPAWRAYKFSCPKFMRFGRDDEELVGGWAGVTAEMVCSEGPTE